MELNKIPTLIASNNMLVPSKEELLKTNKLETYPVNKTENGKLKLNSCGRKCDWSCEPILEKRRRRSIPTAHEEVTVVGEKESDPDQSCELMLEERRRRSIPTAHKEVTAVGEEESDPDQSCELMLEERRRRLIPTTYKKSNHSWREGKRSR